MTRMLLSCPKVLSGLGDILGFIDPIIGAIATISAVRATILNQKDNLEKQHKLSIRLNFLISIDVSSEESEKYSYLSKKATRETFNENVGDKKDEYIWFDILLNNIGIGNSVNIGFSDAKINNTRYCIDKIHSTPCIKQNEEIRFGFMFYFDHTRGNQSVEAEIPIYYQRYNRNIL